MMILFISALLLSLLLTPLSAALALKLNMLDYPSSDKAHSRPTPFLGGVAIYLSFMAVALFNLRSLRGPYVLLMLSATLVFITGLIDDIRPLSSTKRLMVQIAAALILIKGGISFTFLPNTIAGDMGKFILTMVWIVGITNAFNYLDGLNGLLAGVAIINAAFFFIFTYFTGQTVLGYFLIIFIGACAGFFPYNFFRGRVFMGNSGSYWIGFMLAGLAIIGDWAVDNPIDLVIPLLIFGVPIFDMVTTTISRVASKKAKNLVELLDYRGKDHFHYRLSLIGLGNMSAVFFIYLICVILGLNALLLARASGDMINGGIVLCIIGLFFMIILMLIDVFYKK